MVIGDIVRLNSGGPEMVVEDVSDTVRVAWFDGGKFKRYVLPLGCVHLVSSEQPVKVASEEADSCK